MAWPSSACIQMTRWKFLMKPHVILVSSSVHSPEKHALLSTLENCIAKLKHASVVNKKKTTNRRQLKQRPRLPMGPCLECSISKPTSIIHLVIMSTQYVALAHQIHTQRSRWAVRASSLYHNFKDKGLSRGSLNIGRQRLVTNVQTENFSWNSWLVWSVVKRVSVAFETSFPGTLKWSTKHCKNTTTLACRKIPMST